MLRSFVAMLALAVTVPAFASAQDQAQRATSQTPTAAPAKEKKICRSERPVGSIMPQRTCHTAAEWQAIQGQSAEARQRALDNQDNHQMMQGN